MPSEPANPQNSASNAALIGLLHRAAKGIAIRQVTRGPKHHAKERAMGIIAVHRRISQSELLRLVDIRASSLSEVLRQLEQNGLVARERDTADKRNYLLRLTGTGEEAMQKFAEERRKIADAAFVTFSADELARFRALLAKLVSHLEKDSAPNSGKANSLLPLRYKGLDAFIYLDK